MRDLLAATLARIDLGALVAKENIRADRVIAIGKAAYAMAEGASCHPREKLVIGPGDAAHPLPDRTSVSAAERCLDFARGAKRLLVLVSGGASAMVCAPAPGISLATKRAVTKAMLASGAPVQAINVVRKHLSRIKGGGLARAAAPAIVHTLVVSDVIGGDASDVGSGPSVSDATTVAEARRLLRQYAPKYADLALARTGAAPNARPAKILASPSLLAKVAAEILRERGLRVRILPPSQSSAEDLTSEYLGLRLAKNSAVVRVAEPSVIVPKTARGKGGRCTHLAALVARALPDGYAFLAAASDGVDGPSGTGGAFVGHRIDTSRALDRFATGEFFRKAGLALPQKATGQNFADLHLLCGLTDRRWRR